MANTPKRNTDGKPPDPREAELVEDMTLDVMEYVFGRGSEKIVEMLQGSDNTSKTMATAAYKAVRLSAEKHKATATIAMDMDMMMGVSTAAIEMMTEIAEATGQLNAGADTKILQEDTLLQMVVMHGQMLERTPEQREAAMTDLRDYLSDNGSDKAFEYVNQRAAKEGVNVRDMQRKGNEMLYGSKHPVEDKLKAGIKRGLMKDGPREEGIYNPDTQLNYWEDQNELDKIYPDEAADPMSEATDTMSESVKQVQPLMSPAIDKAQQNMQPRRNMQQRLEGQYNPDTGKNYWEDQNELDKMYPEGP